MAKKKASSKKANSASTKTTTRVKSVDEDSSKNVNKSTKSSGKKLGLKKLSLKRDDSSLAGGMLAEFFGTFILVAVALYVGNTAFYLAFAIVAITLIFATVSGAHLNPAISIGAWATKKINFKKALIFVVAQLLGAMLALVLMTSYYDKVEPQPQSQILMQQQQQQELAKVPNKITKDTKDLNYVFFAEFIGTLILGMFYSAASREKSDKVSKAFISGFGYYTSLTIASFAGAFVSATALLNPAIAVGLKGIQFSNEATPESWLVYLIAPILGSIIGFFIYDIVRGDDESDKVKTSVKTV